MTLDGLEEQSSRVYEILSVLAPESIVDLSAGTLLTLSRWSFLLGAYGDSKAINPFSGETDDYLKESREDETRLRDAIRKDLGVDP